MKQNQWRAKANKKENSNNVKKKKEKRISKKTIRRFILTENSKAEELDKLCENKQVKYTIKLAQEFRDIINRKSANTLEDWLKRAEEEGTQAMKSFAKYIKSDYEAVKAAIDYSWNNASLEGSINKLKTIKRQMYNRANIGLLLAKINGFKT